MIVDYRQLIERVAAHVRSQGATVKVRHGRPVTSSDIDRLLEGSPAGLPQSLIDFYLQMGDGMCLDWSTAKRLRDTKPEDIDGRLEPLSIDEFVERVKETAKQWAKDADYDFRYANDPRLAKQTWVRMEKWVRVFEEGNGDTMDIDLSVPSHPLVFNQHDWYDGGTGENGHILAPSFGEWIVDWSKVCFQWPKSLWWPTVLEGPGVAWSSTEFDDRFRLP